MSRSRVADTFVTCMFATGRLIRSKSIYCSFGYIMIYLWLWFSVFYCDIVKMRPDSKITNFRYETEHRVDFIEIVASVLFGDNKIGERRSRTRIFVISQCTIVKLLSNLSKVEQTKCSHDVCHTAEKNDNSRVAIATRNLFIYLIHVFIVEI